ncbi:MULTISPECIES: DUF6446 family protein [unclassified Ruegeria]|uniref:DUF6446 family protein n=1 Tax=unclassified Ruegeria TaxID=2625375 RepID=UPI0014890C32|nr:MULTISPECIES: DUF6446 family protein [unclassified Ruegeria]NOC82009.1 histidine kinase [Ruegeria sp. HKCCD6428]
MTGKLLAIVLLLSALVAGAGMYYLQIYGFYYEVEPQPGQDVVLMTDQSDAPVPITYSDFQAIDADSSPIRYRGCFETDLKPDQMAEFIAVENPEPLTAPGWFDCYDAVLLGDALKSGQAQAFLSEKNIHFGVDRIVAITRDGKGYVWHALNNCGEKAYDGTVVGEECPKRPEN